MFKRNHLRAVNPEQTKNESTGMSVKQIMAIAALTAIGSQLALEAYKAVKKKIMDAREPALPPAPPQFSIEGPQQPFVTTQYGATPPSNPWMTPALPPGGESQAFQPSGMSQAELEEWQRALERREATLERWQRNLESDQRHLRLVSGVD